MQDNTTGRYLSRAQAAKFLGVSIATIDRIHIPRIRVGRRVLLASDDLEAYVASNRSIINRPRPPIGNSTRKRGSRSAWREQRLESLAAAKSGPATE